MEPWLHTPVLEDVGELISTVTERATWKSSSWKAFGLQRETEVRESNPDTAVSLWVGHLAQQHKH